MAHGMTTKLGLLPCSCLLLIGLFPVMTSAGRPMILNVRVFYDSSAANKMTAQKDTPQTAINTLMVETFELLKRLDGYDVDFRLSSTPSEVSDLFSAWDNPQSSIDRFIEWVESNNKKQGSDDFVYLITGLGSNWDSVAGIASFDAMCKRKAGGITKYSGTYRDATTTAHEIGHILGSGHDGEGNRCHPDDGYIMAQGTDATKRNKHYFSRCSVDQINGKYNNYACLRTGNSDGNRVSGPRMGSLLSIDDVCKRVVGPQSNGTVAEECHTLHCLLKTEGPKKTYRYANALPGMACGTGGNKVCNQGSCVNAGSNSGTTQNTWTTQRQPTNPSRPWWETTQRQPTNPSRPWWETTQRQPTNPSRTQDYNRGRAIETTNQFCRRILGGQYEYQGTGSNVCSEIVCRHAHFYDTHIISGTIDWVYCGSAPGNFVNCQRKTMIGSLCAVLSVGILMLVLSHVIIQQPIQLCQEATQDRYFL